MTPNVESGIVCSYAMLRRNWNDMPFTFLNENGKALCLERTRAALHTQNPKEYSITSASPAEKYQLTRLGLLALMDEEDYTPETRVFHMPQSHTCVLVNGDDHLCIHSMLPGFKLDEVCENVYSTRRMLRKQGDFAFDGKYGYLCANPSNTGTGLFAGCLLHLPALYQEDLLEKIAKNLKKKHMLLSPVYDEDDSFSGGFYTLRNTATMGISWEEAKEQVKTVATQLIEADLASFQSHWEENQEEVLDNIWRSWGLLRYAHSLDEAEYWDALGWIRLGCRMGIMPIRLEELDSARLDAATLPEILAAEDPDIERASFLRKFIGQFSDYAVDDKNKPLPRQETPGESVPAKAKAESTVADTMTVPEETAVPDSKGKAQASAVLETPQQAEATPKTRGGRKRKADVIAASEEAAAAEAVQPAEAAPKARGRKRKADAIAASEDTTAAEAVQPAEAAPKARGRKRKADAIAASEEAAAAEAVKPAEAAPKARGRKRKAQAAAAPDESAAAEPAQPGEAAPKTRGRKRKAQAAQPEISGDEAQAEK